METLATKYENLLQKIVLNPIVIMLAFLFLVRPQCVDGNELIDKIFMIVEVLISLIVFFVFFFETILRRKCSVIMIGICTFVFFMALSTLINHGSIYRGASYLLPLFSVSAMSDIILRRDPKKLIDSLSILFGIYVLINLFVVILFPDGIYIQKPYRFPGFFISADNWFSTIMLPACMFSFFAAVRCNTRFHIIWAAIIYFVSLFTIFIRWAVTPIIGTVLYTILFLLWYAFSNKHRRSFTRIFNSYSLFIFAAVIFVGIVFFSIQNLFAPIIEDILHKSLTFTGRTEIWSAEIQYILESPFLGHGFQIRENGFLVFVQEIGYSIGSHNYILAVLSAGGLISLIFLLFAIVSSIYKLYQQKGTIISYLISSMISIFLIMMIMENYGNKELFYVTLLCGFYCSNIIQQYNGTFHLSEFKLPFKKDLKDE